ncbi:MAG TPA: YggS family pyridoxal phosphate-dependent enzyme [Gammaproteobacteria bacterium]|nr:YggS family pyridoxal phosphate-dependent enzyme [Gammaproteobacteria bacterium]
MSGTDLEAVLARLRAAELAAGRAPGAVTLLAASKQQSADTIRATAARGQRVYGENYVQEALPKMAALADLDLSWHFIGRLQRNKTREVAARFDWLHTLDRADLARRLSAQRPPDKPPLQVLIEVNVSGEATKGGVERAEVAALAAEVRRLPRLRLRGLMCLPAPETDPERQRAAFAALRAILLALEDPSLDTLSMGTSGDLEAAIAEGATIVRVGTALFGARA